MSVALLLISLLAVVLLAKKFSLVVDIVTAQIGAPPAFAGVLVALLILLPESVAAISAARKNDLQKSINLALGSSLATIGLTIPAVAVAAYALDKQLVLGLNAQEMVLLVLTFILSMLTFGTGRTNILFGLVHMVVFAVFVFLVFVPGEAGGPGFHRRVACRPAAGCIRGNARWRGHEVAICAALRRPAVVDRARAAVVSKILARALRQDRRGLVRG